MWLNLEYEREDMLKVIVIIISIILNLQNIAPRMCIVSSYIFPLLDILGIREKLSVS